MEEYSLWARIVHQFKKTCSDFDGLWIKRKRLFDTELLVTSLLKLVAGSQKSYHQVLDSLEVGTSIAASSFCEARAKFPSFLISELRQIVVDKLDEHIGCEKWFGLNVYAVDGTKVSLPRNLFREGFKAPSSGYCPQGLVSILSRLSDRIIFDLRLTPQENEREEALEHLSFLSRDDLVVYDRGYLSFALLTAHVNQGVEAVFRVQKGKTFLPIQKFWKSNLKDAVVEISPTDPTYRSTKKQYPDHELRPVRLRLVKYFINTRCYVIATTLLDRRYKIKELKSLYAKRWQVEETYKGLKQTLELESFHSKSRNCIEQELEASALMWNLSMAIAKISQDKLKDKIKTGYQINFRQCVLKLSQNISSILNRLGRKTYKALNQIILYLHRTAQKIRPGRSYPRQSLRPPKHWRKPTPKKSKKKTGRPVGRPRKYPLLTE